MNETGSPEPETEDRHDSDQLEQVVGSVLFKQKSCGLNQFYSGLDPDFEICFVFDPSQNLT